MSFLTPDFGLQVHPHSLPCSTSPTHVFPVILAQDTVNLFCSHHSATVNAASTSILGSLPGLPALSQMHSSLLARGSGLLTLQLHDISVFIPFGAKKSKSNAKPTPHYKS